MQPRLLTSIAVFLGSYLPLAVILFSQNILYDQIFTMERWKIFDEDFKLPLRDANYALVFLAATFGCFLLTVFFLGLVRPKQEVSIIEAEYVPSDLMNYTLPYVVSFMGVDYGETNKFVGFCVFLSWMFWISHKSGQIFLNPVLIAVGWRLYNVNFSFPGSENTFKGRALVRGILEPGVFNQSVIQDLQIIKPKVNDGPSF